MKIIYKKKEVWVFLSAIITFVVFTFISYRFTKNNNVGVEFGEIRYLKWYFNKYQDSLLDRASFCKERGDCISAARIYIIIEQSRSLPEIFKNKHPKPKGHYAKKALRLLETDDDRECRDMYKAYRKYLLEYEPDIMGENIQKDD